MKPFYPGQWHETVNFGSHEVKGDSDAMIWRPGGGIILNPLGLSRFSSFSVNLRLIM